ncbi:hypothetical protein [Fredinandcohnia onubensis]|uniref:hypothetical protein n=1 Tax=Fredinandcohnia onubensis TaxID=1571209 RepID=UPI000C0BFF57|nr:hypothetical protein [Fredinandcohnia onubensis]
MNEDLIINNKPLYISPTLATRIGLYESIILQQLHFWLKQTNHICEERKWVNFTYDQLVEQLPFLSKSTIRRVISSLENNGFIYARNFNKIKMDQKKWYTINYQDLEELKP